jgi:hypothetical protein
MLLHSDPLRHGPLVALEPSIWVTFWAHRAARVQAHLILAAAVWAQVPEQQAITLAGLDCYALFATHCNAMQQ